MGRSIFFGKASILWYNLSQKNFKWGRFMEYVFWGLAAISLGLVCGFYLRKWFKKS